MKSHSIVLPEFYRNILTLPAELTLYVLTFLGGTKHTFSFYVIFHIDMVQVDEIIPQVRQELAYSSQCHGTNNHDIY